jgi:orotidine-5'-phosphate decarboxylase
MGISGSPLDQVVRLAKLTKESGIDGVVCSPLEIEAVRTACGPDFLIVTPGVRPAGGSLGDQRRVMTPQRAMAAGADLLVIGRPITGAADPAAAARAIAADLGV